MDEIENLLSFSIILISGNEMLIKIDQLASMSLVLSDCCDRLYEKYNDDGYQGISSSDAINSAKKDSVSLHVMRNHWYLKSD